MKKALLLSGILNIITGAAGLLLFIGFGGFDLYMGRGTPAWTHWIPSIFLLAGGINLLTACILFKHARKKNCAGSGTNNVHMKGTSAKL